MPKSASRPCGLCRAGMLDNVCTGCGAPADCRCPSCDATVRPIDRFCHSCGTALQQPTSPSPMSLDGNSLDFEEDPSDNTPSPEPQTTLAFSRSLSPEMPPRRPRSSPPHYTSTPVEGPADPLTAVRLWQAPSPDAFGGAPPGRPRQPEFEPEPEPEPLPAGPPPRPVPALHALGSPRCPLAPVVAPQPAAQSPRPFAGRVSPPVLGPSPSSSSQGVSPSFDCGSLPPSLPSTAVLSARTMEATNSKPSSRRASGVVLTDEQRYATLLADVAEGLVGLADFSHMRPRGQRVVFFQLPQILTAVSQSPACHTLKLSYNDLTSSDVRNYLLPFFAQTRIQKVWIDGNPGILADVAREILEVNRARPLPLWIETNETGLPPAVRIQLKQIDNAEYLARRQLQERSAVDTDKKWGTQQRFHQGRTVKPYVSQGRKT